MSRPNIKFAPEGEVDELGEAGFQAHGKASEKHETHLRDGDDAVVEIFSISAEYPVGGFESRAQLHIGGDFGCKAKAPKGFNGKQECNGEVCHLRHSRQSFVAPKVEVHAQFEAKPFVDAGDKAVVEDGHMPAKTKVAHGRKASFGLSGPASGVTIITEHGHCLVRAPSRAAVQQISA